MPTFMDALNMRSPERQMPFKVVFNMIIKNMKTFGGDSKPILNSEQLMQLQMLKQICS